ncbi:MAG: 3-deoxy-manno-octulosonate cytidylyltransferase [Candidatus Puniceispirillaceae bacterium]
MSRDNKILHPQDDLIILIPARMAASRLPGKPMADIAGKPLIEHVWAGAVSASIAPVFVATDHEAIYDHITSCGGQAVMTKDTHPSGSDRIYEAIMKIDPSGRYQKLINLQGDLPTITTKAIRALAHLLSLGRCDLATLVAKATTDEISKPQVVKAVMSWDKDGLIGRAHYFSRQAVPHNATDYWHHIGLYGWQRQALERFVSLPPSPLEQTEKLEQLRALEAGMMIEACVIDEAPGGVDTMADLNAVRAHFTP